jgi:hypothetical protein
MSFFNSASHPFVSCESYYAIIRGAVEDFESSLHFYTSALVGEEVAHHPIKQWEKIWQEMLKISFRLLFACLLG